MLGSKAGYRRRDVLIILGPDCSGKTTLAKRLELPYYHFDYNSKYEDYLKPLCSLEMTGAVLDRHILCEYSYSTVMGRKFAFSMKEWHNIILLTLAQNPVIILCTHKPPVSQYSADQYLPYDKWDQCLELYKEFLNTHHIRHIEYDYTQGITPKSLSILESKYRNQMSWWIPMWKSGWGFIGSTYPKVLLVAERLGPNNMNNLPFETGPTGKMLTDMLALTGTPLGKFAVTNLIKSYRRDTRPPNQQDLDLLRLEFEHLKPQKVCFMGSLARFGVSIAKELNIPYENIVHFGYFSHKGIHSVSPYIDKWRSIMGIIP